MMFEPVSGFPLAERRRVRAVLTDIDDTLTDEGRLSASAYDALARLKAAGFKVVPVTGRPAGWCDLIARQWPVDGVVGENGAFWFRYDDSRRKMIRRYARTETERAADRAKLDEIRRVVLEVVQGSAVAADQPYRVSDLAIDFCEDVPRLPRDAVDRIVAVFNRYGATAKISSIHVNGWFGSHDKLTMSRHMLQETCDIDVDAAPDRVVFVGDSPNDAPMFGFFPNSVGVANVLDFRERLAAPPHWVTTRARADGFAELADLLIAARN